MKTVAIAAAPGFLSAFVAIAFTGLLTTEDGGDRLTSDPAGRIAALEERLDALEAGEQKPTPRRALDSSREIAGLRRELDDLRALFTSAGRSPTKITRRASDADSPLESIIDDRILAAQEKSRRAQEQERREVARVKHRNRASRQARSAAKRLSLGPHQTKQLTTALADFHARNADEWGIVKGEEVSDAQRLESLGRLRANVEALRTEVGSFMSTTQIEQYEGLEGGEKGEESPLVVPTWLTEWESRLREGR